MKILYVGIDVGATLLAASLSEKKGARLGRAREFQNRPLGFKQLVAWAEAAKDGADGVHACYESTGVYGLRLTDYLMDRTDWKVSVMNPSTIKAFRKSVLAKTKTDAQDSYYHAQFAAIFDPPGFIRPEPVFKELEQVMAARLALVRIVRTEKTQLYVYGLRPIRNRAVMTMKRERVARNVADAKAVLAEGCRVALTHPKSKGYIDLLCTIPGVGVQTAVSVLSKLVSMNPASPDCRQLVSYAGLDAVEKQSGTSVRGRVKMSGKGNVHFREPLYMAALTATKANPVIKILYDRMVAAGKPKRKALITCMPRMLRLMWGVFRTGKPFDLKIWQARSDKGMEGPKK